MKLTERIAALCMALLAAVGIPAFAIPANAADGAVPADFTPVLRFAAASDTHVQDGSDATAGRIGTMMEMAYEIADADGAYPNVDALLVVGDLTNDGTATEFDKFQAAVDGALREGTRFLGVVAKNHDGWTMSRKEMRAYYSSVSGNEPDFHTVIGGFHFIGLSASPSQAQHYDLKQLSWLKKQLDEAVADTPDLPVFVMHHEHPAGTVYGSSAYDRWSVSHFNSILNQYAQAVDLSGHSHYPLNDPRSLWQGVYTAIGTGAIYYTEMTVNWLRSYNPPGYHEVSAFWLVEADAKGNLRLRGMDVMNRALLCEYYLKNPANPANREYTPAKREAASTAPEFAPDAALTVTPVYGGCEIAAPAARSTDGMPVVLYRAQAKSKTGAAASKSWTLPTYYSAAPQEEIALTLSDLAAGEYTVSLTAETAYGVQSQPLETTVTVDGQSAFAAFFRHIGVWFRELFAIVKSWF